MKVGEKKFVSLSYELVVDGQVADKSQEGAPLEFPFGSGFLLPKFEENIKDLKVGDKFAFTLSPEEGYGVEIAEAIVELPKSIFMIEGKVEEGLLVVGNQVPMATADGQRMVGVVKIVAEESVTMDFNHPMAGKTLNFTGEILALREATEADLNPYGATPSCNCEDKSKCDSEGCDCNC